MKTLALISVLFGLLPILYAEDAPQPTPVPSPPLGPLLERAPTFAQWTVTTELSIDSKEEKSPAVNPAKGAEPGTGDTHRHKKTSAESPDRKPPPDLPQQTTSVIKTKAIRYEQTIADDGMKTERWCLPEMQVIVQGSEAPVVAFPGTKLDSNYIDYSKADFAGFDWISQGNFSGIEEMKGQECFVFRTTLRQDGIDTVTVAYINTATRLPVMLQLGEQSSVYEFEVAPTAMIVLPPDVAALAEKWQLAIRQSSLAPAKP